MTVMPDPARCRRAAQVVCRDNFFHFVWRVFATLHADPAHRFVPAWHVEAICKELEDLRNGINRRLVITMPPRCLKSITVAVAYPAFLLGHGPHTKIMVASYGLDLARKHAEDCRRVMEAPWYKQMFPRTRLATRGTTIDELRTTQGGGRKAVSLGSSVTGHGADTIIIDDLLKAADAGSEVERYRAQDFIEATLLSRFDNPAEGRVVMVAQRLHEMDPPGYLLGKGTYRHLNLPAIAEVEDSVLLPSGRVHRRLPGQALFPERLDLDALERLRRELGTAVFNCQYQQNPIAPDGSPLRWEWFGTYDEVLEPRRYELIVQSWDTGMSADPRSDYSVCTTWGFAETRWHLLDVFRARLDYPDLKKAVTGLVAAWDPDKVLIEDAATGKPLFDELFRNDRRRFRKVPAVENKEIRFAAACASVEEGKVLLPSEAAWLADFKRELQSFPRGRHDDQVDSFSQFLNWSKGNGFWRALDRQHPLRVERRSRPIRRRPARRSLRSQHDDV